MPKQFHRQRKHQPFNDREQPWFLVTGHRILKLRSMMNSSFLLRRLFWALPLPLFLPTLIPSRTQMPRHQRAPGSPPVSETSHATVKTDPQTELAKAFDGASTTLLELKTAEQFSQVTANADEY